MTFLYDGPAGGSPPGAPGRMMARVDERGPVTPDRDGHGHDPGPRRSAGAGGGPRHRSGDRPARGPTAVALIAVAAALGVALLLRPLAG